MKSFTAIVLAAVLALCQTSPSAEGDLLDVRDSQDEPVKLIFDTDIGGDIDDAFALALIHRFADRGQCELLGVTLTTANEQAAKFVAAENAVFGRPEIPIGLPAKGTVYDSYPTKVLEQKNADGTPLYPVPDGYHTEDPVALLRRLLANADDRSVVIAQVGYSTNLANLLDSPGDGVSPLTGKELAAKKVRLLSIMGGGFAVDPSLAEYGKMREWNIVSDIPAAQKLAREWPGEIVYSGSEIGNRILMSTVSLNRDYRTPRAKFLHDAYYWWAESDVPGLGFNHERPTWDLTSVFFVVRPEKERGYYRLSEPGSVSFSEEGVASFTPDPNGKRRVFLVDRDAAIRVREAFVNLCAEP